MKMEPTVSSETSANFIHLPMKMEPTVSSETSAIRTQTPGNYPKRNKLNIITIMTIARSHFVAWSSTSAYFSYWKEGRRDGKTMKKM